MNVSELVNDRRTRAFNILLVIWFSLFIITGLFFPIMAVVPDGPVSDLLRTAFFVVGGTMMSLALLIFILMFSGVITVPHVSEPKDAPWPFTLLAGFLLACILASGIVIKTADRVGTHTALVQISAFICMFMLPFVIFAIVLPLIIQRYYSGDYARKAKSWGYAAAMLIDFGIWYYISDISLSFILKESTGTILIVVGYLIFLAIRRIRRNARS